MDERGRKAGIRRTAVVVLLGIAGLCFAARADEALPPGVAWTRVRPTVLWCGDRSSVATVEAHVEALDDVAAVRIVGPNDAFDLYDDGTRGDVFPGDGVYTAGDVRPYCNRGFSLKYGKTLETWYGTLEITLNDGRTLIDTNWVRIGLINPRLRQVFDVAFYGDGLSATAHAFFIEDLGLDVFDGYPLSSVPLEHSLRAATQQLYRFLPDAFDFVIVMPGMPIYEPERFTETNSATVRVSNAVEGIGLPVFDRSEAFGSSGRLQSVILQSFGSIESVDYELANRWGALLGSSLGLVEETENGATVWNPLSDVGGQLAGYYVSVLGEIGRFADNGDGSWRFVPFGVNEPYAPLELYAMGLLGEDEVPAIHILHEPNLADPDHVTATSVETITIEEIVAEQGGPRRPGVERAQKDFQAALIVVQDDTFTDAEYAYYSFLAFQLTSPNPPVEFDFYAPFHWATGGRGRLATELPVNLPDIPELLFGDS